MTEQNKQKGLPMTSKWDPDVLAREVAELDALEKAPLGTKIKGYLKRTGPGLLQSAMTLGAGSAAASIAAGAYYGYSLLWVQPLAMFLGIMMLAALGKVVLTTGERPYAAFGREINKPIVFLWALGTVMASVIWHFPQYGLAAGAARDLAIQLGKNVENAGGVLTGTGYAVSFGIGFIILAINIFTTWNYGSGSKGIKLYEWFLRGTIATVIIMFGIVVVRTGIKWDILKECHYGFGFPRTTKGITTVLGAIGAAVGINMTFLFPYSLLAKGWGKSHRTLMRWDLVFSMFLPFILVTSLVIIAMSNTVYPLDPTKRLTPVAAAAALVQVIGPVGRVIFDLGFIAMSCGAISTHMVVCGFTICEMFGLEYTPKRFRMFSLVPAIGLLGVVTKTPLWMPVAASAVCLTMLPIAYLVFFIMYNKRSYLGDEVGRGWKHVLTNIILLIAIAMATVGAAVKIKSGVIDKIPALIGKNQPAVEHPVQPKAR